MLRTRQLHFAVEQLGLAVVRPDTTLRRDANSLFLYTVEENGSWREAKKLTAGTVAPVHDPRFSIAAGVLGLSWTQQAPGAGPFANAIIGHPLRGDSKVFTLSRSASEVRLLRNNAALLWVIQDQASVGSVLRIAQIAGDTLLSIGEYRHAFAGPVGIEDVDGDLLIAGPVLGARNGQTPVTTEVVAIRIQCKKWS